MSDLGGRFCMAVLGEEILYGGFVWRICMADFGGRILVVMLDGRLPLQKFVVHPRVSPIQESLVYYVAIKSSIDITQIQ